MYIEGFENKEGVFRDFNVREEDKNGVRILVAFYTSEGYEGSAYVLFTKDNKYYEVSGGHCSCMGLEDQWDPEEVDEKYLLHRVENGEFDYDKKKDKKMKEAVLKSLLDRIVEEEVLLH